MIVRAGLIFPPGARATMPGAVGLLLADRGGEPVTIVADPVRMAGAAEASEVAPAAIGPVLDGWPESWAPDSFEGAALAGIVRDLHGGMGWNEASRALSDRLAAFAM